MTASPHGRPFGSTYAHAYDAMYAEKDYRGECDLVEEALARFGSGAQRRLLDIGCGTGNHSIELARRGYEVTGVDLSPEMLGIAAAKAATAGVDARWIEGDARNVDAGSDFDAVLLMFAVLGYQRANEDLRATLATARRHLRAGGLLIFDAWYGPGVLTDPPRDRTRTLLVDGREVRRTVHATLDTRHHLCTVSYLLECDGEPDAHEEHVMRYFFPMELETHLEQTGFHLRSLTPFGTLDGTPTASDWNVLAVAEAM